MYPILLRVGPVTIYSFGLAIALAFLAAMLVVRFEVRRRGFHPDLSYDIVLWALVGGIIGSRIIYVVGHWNYYTDDPIKILLIQSGGLVWYGGLLGGAAAVILFLKKKNLPLATFADIVAPALPLGAAVGRIGCFLNGCCYGKPTSLPWAVDFLGAQRHPTQIYEFFMNLAIFGIVWSVRKRMGKPGTLFWLYLALYSLARFSVEFVRVTIPVWIGLSGSQLLSILLFIAAISMLLLIRAAKD